MTSNSVKVLLVRHGETDWNAVRRIQGGTDIPLNDTGRLQAREAVHRLKEHGIEHILSSTKLRARETAALISEGLGVAVSENADLREISYGAIEGLTVEEIRAQHGELFFQRWDDHSDLDFDFIQGESKRSARERTRLAIESFVTSNAYGTVLVATHGAVMRYFLNTIATHEQVPKIGNCACYILVFDRDNKTWKFCGSV